jgi:hypothetical protein
MKTNVTQLRVVLLIVAVSAIACGSTLWLAFRQGSISRDESAQAPVFPYTLETQTVQRLPDGERRVTEKRLTAIRGDGAELWISSIPSDSGPKLMRRLVTADGFMTAAAGASGVKMSRYLPASAMKGRRLLAGLAETGCRYPYEESLGEQMLVGVRVAVAVRQSSDTERRTAYRALDYGCAGIGLRLEDFVDGNWRLRLESMPISFVGGEPAEELFDPKFFRDLKEMSPSQSLRRMQGVLGVSEADCPGCLNFRDLNRLDREYRQYQSPR